MKSVKALKKGICFSNIYLKWIHNPGHLPQTSSHTFLLRNSHTMRTINNHICQRRSFMSIKHIDEDSK
jgi:hypothetical protein